MRKRYLCLAVTLLTVFSIVLAQTKAPSEADRAQISFYKVFEQNNLPDFENWQGILSKLSNSQEDFSWKIYTALTDDLGQVHYRAQQYFKGIPLENGVVIIHTFENKILSINGEIIPKSLISGSAKIDKKSALEIAVKAYPSESYYWQDEAQNALLRVQTGVEDTSWVPLGSAIYCPKDLNYLNLHRLAFKFDIYSQEPLFGKRIYVDASNGEIIATEELILHTDVKGTAQTAFSGTREITTDSVSPSNYRLRELARGKGIETYNMQKGTSYGASVDFTDANNNWNNVNANKDEVATDAHWGAERTYDFFDSMLGRNSFDGNGAKIISYVHYSNNYSNAFWNGSYMTYGDGNGSTWKPLISIDVCGHEIAHAVTTYTAGLVYSYESGALNESFSDIFGNAIERWARPGKYDWKIGEDFTTSGAGIRDMANPNPYNNPKYYKGNNWYFGAGDNGGVHYNSGVQNYWFYLITDGISGTNQAGNSFAIQQLGLEDAAKIAYRNLAVYLTKNSQYIDARKYSIIAATDLFGNCSKHVIAVTNAWWACGVGAKYDSGYVKANFIADTLVCSPAKPVKFSNLSENSISAKWYFGDGSTSTTYSPVHNYSAYGTYTVKLVAQSCWKNFADSNTRTSYVVVDSSFDICKGVTLPKNGTDSAVLCQGFVYDDGGEGNYGAMRQVNLKLKIPGATSIKFRFLVLDYENGYDSIVLFRNNTANANKIGRFTGNTIPFGGAWQTVTADALWFRQYTDPLVEGKGFKIQFEGIRNPLTLNVGNDTTICMGDSLVLNAQTSGGYAPDYQYVWEDNSTSSLRTVKPVTTSKYLVKLTDVCTNLSNKDSILVSVRPALQVKLGNDTVICSGNSVVLSAIASGGLNTSYFYTWTNGFSNLASHTVTPIITTTYRVVLNDGCTELSDTAFKTIYVKPALSVGISATDTLVCIGKSITLTASASGGDTAGHTFNWNQGLGTGKSKTINLNDTGIYSITLTDGCSVAPAVVNKTLYTYPALSLAINADSIICRGSGIDLLATGSGGRGNNYSYTWSHGKTSAAITEFPSTARFFKVTFSDACSPSVSDSTFVDLLAPLLLSNRTDTTLCDGQSLPVTLLHSGGLLGNHTITWQPSGLSGFSVNLNPTTGTTNYRAILSDGCTVLNDTTLFKITKLPPLSANITVSPNAICMGDSISMSFTLSGGKTANHSWTLNGVPVGFLNQKLMPLTPTNYNLLLSDGCSLPASASDAVTISPAASAVLSVDNPTVCLGSTVNFKYSSADAFFVRWYFSNGDSALGTGIDYPKVLTPAGAYTATARVVTSQGCTGIFTLAPTVNIIPYPNAVFNAIPAITNIENPVINFVEGSTGATDYVWTFGDGTNSLLPGNQSHTYGDTGYYQVTLKVSIAPGCVDSVSRMVRVKDVYRLYLPNSFSPDGNNVNDIYKPAGRGIKTFHMVIYNRWGMKVFETLDMAKGWDGVTPDGGFWTPGLYLVMVEVIDTEDFRHIEKGTILILD